MSRGIVAIALALALAGAPSAAEAKPAIEQGESQPVAPQSVTIEIVEVYDGSRETRSFQLALDDEDASHLHTSDEAGSYKLTVRARQGPGDRSRLELSLERNRRREGRSSHAELSVRREVERGKATMMSRLAQAKGHLIVRATLR